MEQDIFTEYLEKYIKQSTYNSQMQTELSAKYKDIRNKLVDQYKFDELVQLYWFVFILFDHFLVDSNITTKITKEAKEEEVETK